MAKQGKRILRQIRDEAKHQLRGFPQNSSTSSVVSAVRPHTGSAAVGARSSPGRSLGFPNAGATADNLFVCPGTPVGRLTIVGGHQAPGGADLHGLKNKRCNRVRLFGAGAHEPHERMEKCQLPPSRTSGSQFRVQDATGTLRLGARGMTRCPSVWSRMSSCRRGT